MCSIELRDYQKKACQEVEKIFTQKLANQTILSIPTGGGKTVTAMVWAKWALDQKRVSKIVWVAHRKELIDQACIAAKSVGINFSLWSPSHKPKNTNGSLIITTNLSWRGIIPSIRGCKTLLIFDESHHAAADSYQNLWQAAQPVFTLGLTATPTRLDGKDTGFNNIAYQKSFLDLVELGHLAKPIYIRIRTEVPFSERLNAGEFQQKDLAKLNCEERNELIAKEIGNHPEYGKQLVFCVNREHAEELKQVILAETTLGDNDVKALDSKYPLDQRQSTTDWFRESYSKPRVLLNCALFIEGFDVPDINTIHLARPTASKTYYMQMLGRGSRKIPKQKETFNIVDYVDQCDKYAYLAEEWSMDELNAQEDEVLEERRQNKANQQERWEDLQNIAEEEDIKLPKKYKKDVMEVHGIATLSSDFYQNRKYIITKQEKKVIEKLFVTVLKKNLGGREFYPIVDAAFDNIVGLSDVMSQRKFRNLAWAMWRRYCKKQHYHVEGGIMFFYRKI